MWSPDYESEEHTSSYWARTFWMQYRIDKLEKQLKEVKKLLDEGFLENNRYYDFRRNGLSGPLTNLGVGIPAAWKARLQNQTSRIIGLPKHLSNKTANHIIYSALTALVASPALPVSSLELHLLPLKRMAVPDLESASRSKRDSKHNRSKSVFLCTFCWVPKQLPVKSHIIGESERIACERCYNSILDLAICWICGELIVRGEDVVSLGWCFWHKGCFGCLLCLQPLQVQDYLPEDRCCSLNTRRLPIAIELEEPPLCTYCDGISHDWHTDEIISRGLKQVNRRDGGLSQSRYERSPKRRKIDHVGHDCERHHILKERKGTNPARKDEVRDPQLKSSFATLRHSNSMGAEPLPRQEMSPPAAASHRIKEMYQSTYSTEIKRKTRYVPPDETRLKGKLKQSPNAAGSVVTSKCLEESGHLDGLGDGEDAVPEGSSCDVCEELRLLS